jgi:hypothetical protein
MRPLLDLGLVTAPFQDTDHRDNHGGGDRDKSEAA